MVHYRFDVKLARGAETRQVSLYACNRCEAVHLVERGYPGWSVLHIRTCG